MQVDSTESTLDAQTLQDLPFDIDVFFIA